MDGITTHEGIQISQIYQLTRREKDFILYGYSISAILSILLNCISIITIPRVKDCFGENTKLCLMFLAVTDLVTGLLCSTSGVIFVYVPVTKGVADTIVVLCTAFVWQSMWILTLASVDRYIAVTRPLQYHSIVTRKMMIIALTTVMILALLNSGGSYLQSVLTGECHPFGNICLSLIKPSFIIYALIPLTALIVTTYVNVRLVLISHSHARQIAALEAAVNAGNIAPPPPRRAGMKGLKTVLVITCMFYLAWIPGTIVSFINPIPAITVPPVITLIMRYAITSNSWWNACVYFFMNKSYRRLVFKIIGSQIRRFHCRSSIQVVPNTNPYEA
nr:probable G-protein coupled receptor 21 [Lytechinus pictus]